jgi:hypothetical protein
VSHWSDVTASSWAGVRQAFVPLLRVPPSYFEGAACGPYESGRHSVTELTLASPHSDVLWRGWPRREGWRNSAGIRFPGGVRGAAWRRFIFDLSTCIVSEH